MSQNANEPTEPTQRNFSPPPVLRWGLLGLMLVTGLALAAPRHLVVEVPRASNCSAPDQAGSGGAPLGLLPPGHPPIGDTYAQGRATTALPPGHPPVEGYIAGRGRPARPLFPTFTAPTSIDL